MDIAEIGFLADTADLATGEKRLDSFATKAESTEKRVERAAADTSKALKKTSAGAKDMGAGLATSATRATALGNSMRGASMQTANLAAQFNDIGVMLAAGQNPLQLALQQGTQINQVFAQMGGHRSAIRGLGTAVMSMVNPMSLATIGIIAGGAALTQWAISASNAGTDADALQEAVDELDAGLSDYRDTLADVLSTGGDLEKNFKGQADAARGLLAELSNIQRLNLRDSASDLSGGLRLSKDDTFKMFGFGSISSSDRRRFAGQENILDAVEGAQGVDELAKQMERLLINTKILAELNNGVNADEREYIQMLTERLIKLKEIQGTTSQNAEEVAEQRRLQQELDRLASASLTNASREAEMERLVGQQLQDRVKSREQGAQAAQKVLSELNREIALQTMIAQFGEDHVSVARLRAQQEREVFVEMTNSRDISEELKDQLIAAFDAAAALSQANMSGAITQAANEAARLADELFRASRVGLRQTISDEDAVMSQSVTAAPTTRAVANFGRLTAPRRSRRGGGGGGGRSRQDIDIFEASQRQVEALQREIQTLGMAREEVARLEAAWELTDRAKKAGIKVTDELTKKINGEAAEVGRLTEELNKAKDRQESFQRINQTFEDSLVDAAIGGADAFDDLGEAIKRAAAQYLLFGKGPLAKFGGGGGFGGILGGLVGKLFSFDGGGYTGDGPRSGGVDGKGGFPAILHPREKVVDLTKGQGSAMAQNLHVSVSVDGNGNLRAMVKDEAGREVARSAPEIAQQGRDLALDNIRQTREGIGF